MLSKPLIATATPARKNNEPLALVGLFGRVRSALDPGRFQEVVLDVAPDLEIALCELGHGIDGIGAHNIVHLIPHQPLLFCHKGQTLFQVAGKGLLYVVTVETNHFGKHLGGKQRLTTGFLFDDYLQQNTAGKIFFRIRLNHAEFAAAQHKLTNVGQCYIAAELRVIESAIWVLFDDSYCHATSPMNIMLAMCSDRRR